jgi:hypothetical protein
VVTCGVKVKAGVRKLADDVRMQEGKLLKSADSTAEAPRTELAEAANISVPEVPPGKKFVAYTVKLPSDQLAALQSIWLELKRLYGSHSPDKSGMIQQAIGLWLKRWDGPDREELLKELLEIREETRKRQYRKS